MRAIRLVASPDLVEDGFVLCRALVDPRLAEAYRARDVHLIFLPVDPRWDAYRDDPRFRALLERCGFPRVAALR